MLPEPLPRESKVSRANRCPARGRGLARRKGSRSRAIFVNEPRVPPFRPGRPDTPRNGVLQFFFFFCFFFVGCHVRLKAPRTPAPLLQIEPIFTPERFVNLMSQISGGG